MPEVILISILLITLIYLHIKQSDLIFQLDVKIAKVLSMIALLLIACSSYVSMVMTKGRVVELVFLYNCVIWLLVIIAYWRLLSGCCKVAFFNRIGSVEPGLRAKVRGILQQVRDKKQRTEELNNFLQVSFNDPLIEEIRCRCKEIFSVYDYRSEEDFEKIEHFVEMLGE